MKRYLLVSVLLGWALSANAQVMLRDPTCPPDYGVNPLSSVNTDFKLMLIKYSHKKKYALIDGQYLVEGDMLRGYRVVSISKNQVKLVGEKGYIALTILARDIRQPIHATRAIGS